MATFVFFDEFKPNVTNALINLGSDTFKWALTNTAPTVASDDELADITQITGANGYTTGGATASNVSWAETSAGSGIWKFTCDDVTFTASGGSMGAFRYYVLYSDTSTGDKLVGYVDRGSSLTLATGQSATLDIGTDGIFQLDG